MSRTPDSIIQWAARQVGIDPRILRALGQQESGGMQRRANGQLVRSPVGAIGFGQLMPATARGLGVDPTDERQNVLGAAKYLRQQLDTFGGDLPKALAAYNAGPGAVKKYGGVPPYRETQNYVSRITSALQGRYNPTPAPAPPPAPTGYVPRGTPSVDPRQAVLARMLGGDSLAQQVAAKKFAVPDRPDAPTPAVGPTPMPEAGAGKLVGSPIDRPGAPTSQSILDFVRRTAGILGQPIQLGTGTHHDRLTTNGTVSAHYAGHALDLPAVGEDLVRKGQAALIAAGADPAWARRQRAGLFNVGRYQVIFGTNSRRLGGNHTNHVHVGER